MSVSWTHVHASLDGCGGELSDAHSTETLPTPSGPQFPHVRMKISQATSSLALLPVGCAKKPR